MFVAGATGYLGRFVVKEALERGYKVRALARDKARLPPELAEIAQGPDFEVVEGEATRPETLRGLTRDCDVLFSSVGITRQRDAGVTYADVDYGANRNLLDEARRSGSVDRFVYTHVLNAEKLLHVELIAAKHRFVSELKRECEETKRIRPCVVRPSGFYSDLEEILEMALSGGRVYVLGEADRPVSPIWGGDLARAIVDALGREEEDLPIGGPETLSFMRAAELAKRAVEEGYAAGERTVAIWSVPRCRVVKVLFQMNFIQFISS